MKKEEQIIAIGGGGFSRYGMYTPENLLMEKYFLSATGKPCPNICFIPTASGESAKYIIDFYKAFQNFSCKARHLSLFEIPTHDLEGFLLDQDAIYVGGGNTKSMLALWREWKIDLYLRKALSQGVVLGGVSAGSLCWFEEGVTDSIPKALTRLECLGFIPGSHCPHYDGEKQRRPAYHRLIKEGMQGGVAAEDHVALHYVDGILKKVVRANQTGVAYRVGLEKGEVQERMLEIENISLC